MEFQHYQVGAAIPEYIGCADGMYASLSQSGLSFTIIMDSLTQKEIGALREGTEIDIRFYIKKSILFFLVKLGDMPYMDAPFSPHIGGYVPMEYAAEGQGLLTTFVLVDSADGTVKGLWAYGLSTSRTNELKYIVDTLMDYPLTRQDYLNNIAEVYSTMTTSAMVSISKRNDLHDKL